MDLASRSQAEIGFALRDSRAVPAAVGQRQAEWSYYAGLALGTLTAISGLGLLLIGLLPV